jgi:hypothetical protein
VWKIAGAVPVLTTKKNKVMNRKHESFENGFLIGFFIGGILGMILLNLLQRGVL